nr:unnamed protein product [Callosobruchus analis]
MGEVEASSLRIFGSCGHPVSTEEKSDFIALWGYRPTGDIL